MTTLWSCPNPECPPTEVAPTDVSANDDSRKGELTKEEVAEHLGVPVRTLYKWHREGTGPPLFRIGKYVRYRKSDVERWLTEQAGPLMECSGSGKTYRLNEFTKLDQ